MGYDDDLNRLVAIKVLCDSRLDSARSLEMLRAEARKLANLKHPAIVAVHDVGPAVDGGCFVVMEYIAGGSLKDRLKSRHMSLKDIAAGIATAADALYHARPQGFVHCDVKPGNLLIDGQGGFHVADFRPGHPRRRTGTIQRVGRGNAVLHGPRATRNETHRLDGRTDVWELGVVLYELLTLTPVLS